MEETKLQALHDSLSKLTGRQGLGLAGQYSWQKKNKDQANKVYYGLPTNSLYANFVPEGALYSKDGSKPAPKQDGDGRFIKLNFSDNENSSGEDKDGKAKFSKEERKSMKKAKAKAEKLKAKKQAKLEVKRLAKKQEITELVEEEKMEDCESSIEHKAEKKKKDKREKRKPKKHEEKEGGDGEKDKKKRNRDNDEENDRPEEKKDKKEKERVSTLQL